MTPKIPSVAAAVLLLAAAPVPAQPQRGMGPRMPMYDLKTETTLTGTVAEVRTVSEMMGGRGGGMGMQGRGMQGMGMEGTHVMLKTDAETIEVHVGPSAFLKERQVELLQGDAIEVLGSRVKIGEADALLAREIRKGETRWTLRDASGRPEWMRMMGRP
jgi:hypothetical protein